MDKGLFLILTPTKEERIAIGSVLSSMRSAGSLPFSYHLRDCGGVGLVNAAATTAVETQEQVDGIFIVGMALGDHTLHTGDVILPTRVYNMDAQVPPQATLFTDLTKSYDLFDGRKTGPVCYSGSRFITSDAELATVGVPAVYDMSTYAVAQIADDLGLPCTSIQMVVDVIDGSGSYSRYCKARDCISTLDPIVFALVDSVVNPQYFK